MNAHLVRARFGLLAVIATASLIAVATVAAPMAGANTISPAGCEDNGIVVDIGRSPGVVQPGDTVTYTISVHNGVLASAPKPCDVTGATVSLEMPSTSTGQPNGSPEIIVSNHDFLADGTGNIGPISRTFTVPDAPLVFGNATARVSLTNALLHDSNFVDDFADTSKTVSAAIVDAHISITPNGINEIIPPGSTPHTFTAHAERKIGNLTDGYESVAEGTTINFTIAGVGTLSATSCQTVGTTGSCSVTDSSATTGHDTVNASATQTLAGITVTRSTNGTGGNSGPATKTWVDANIQITPATATNAVGDTHTLTGHVNVNGGSGFANAPSGTVINFSLTNSGGATATFVGANNCATSGTTGSCTVQITSPTAGSTAIHATTTVSVGGVGGVSLTRATGDGLAGDSANANKIWVVCLPGTCPSTTVTVIHNANHDVINSFKEGDGTVVHDKATVTGQPGNPPTGTVTFRWFANDTCAGTAAQTSGAFALEADGTVDATTFAFGNLNANIGGSFKATYSGDNFYTGSVGDCESLTGVAGETSPPKTAPPTDGIGSTTTPTSNDALPALLLIMAVIGLGAIFLTPARARR